jgi:hypothetical protein
VSSSCMGAVLAGFFSVLGSLAASPLLKPNPIPSAALGPISAALCGRGAGSRAALANALDKFGPIALPPIWREAKIETLQRWLEAPICPEASESESNLYTSRHMVLDQLGRRLERAKVTEKIGSALARFRGLRPSSVEWPSSSECDGCAALRSSAAEVADIASLWPLRTSTQVGARLDDAAKHEPLVAKLCAARPAANARADIEKRFRYYSWTASAASLFEVAALFEQPEVVAGCRVP